MEKIILNAENISLGRLASTAAKMALQGNEVDIINSEKAVITGRKKNIIKEQKAVRAINTMKPRKGPFLSKNPEKILKRTIRSMVPNWRNGRGKVALKNIKCYLGVPENLRDKKARALEGNKSNLKISLKELGEEL
jgi:large subunit ribosomal protein L13